MRNYIIISIITLFLAQGPAGAQVKISGLVRDRVSGEVLIGASVFEPVSMNGTATDNNGYFSLSLKQSADSLLVTYVGYSTYIIPMREMQDSILDIFLEPGASIDEVRVSAFRKQTFNRSVLTNEQFTWGYTVAEQID